MSEQISSAHWLTGVLFDGHFEVGHLIARGGMAEVYHAVDLWSNNPVAIKVLLPHLSGDPTQRQKFFREGSALSKLKHDHVVGVIASGTQAVHGQQVMYLVLEYVHGCTLAQLLMLRPVLSVGEMLEIMLPAVEGLSEVHAHQLIHRDMKPANVLLEDTSQSIKLSDFGLTRRADQSTTGTLMGTPAFVAPEILDIHSSEGPAADIFAVGIMMFRMVVGRTPFAGSSNDQQVLYHNTNTDIPSVARLVSGISPDIAGVISWCTRRAAKDRPQDATELFRVLRDIRERLSKEELAFRAAHLESPLSALWDDVTAIAEKSGMTKVYRSTSISAFGSADDLMNDEDSSRNFAGYEHLSDHEQAALQAAHTDAEVYELTNFTVGPPTEEEALTDEHDDVFLDDEDFTGTIPSASYENISAGYNPQRIPQAASSSYSDSDSGQRTEPRRPADPTLWSDAQRRHPQQAWKQPTSPALLVFWLALLVVGFVAAGFTGWWLAQLFLSAL